MFWDGERWGPEKGPLIRSKRTTSRLRLRRWLVAVPILFLMTALVVPVVSTEAATYHPRVVVGVAAPGGLVTLTGSGLRPGGYLQARLDRASTRLGLIRVNRRGRFSVQLRLPSTTTPGTHLVTIGRVSYGGLATARIRSTRLLAQTTILSVKVSVKRKGGKSTSVSPPAPAPTPTPTPVATPAPTPTQGPTVTGVYGSGIGMDSLNNTQIGGLEAKTASYRFRAAYSSALTGVRIYIQTGSRYSGGTFGTLEVTVQTNGSGNMPSGTVLATTTIRPADVIRPSGNALPLVSWSVPASLTAGQLYHIVFRNIDSNPTTNYASINGVFMYQPTVPRQPTYNNVDWGQPIRSGSGAWADSLNTVPLADLRYANGKSQGLGYMEDWVRSYVSISGTSLVREQITPTVTRTVSEVNVRLMRISGSSPLVLTMKGTSATCSIPAASIPIGVPGDHSGTGHATWVRCTFPAVTLAAGTTYNLVLSAPSDTIYSIFVIRKGVDYNFAPSTYFAEGRAQHTSGSTWVPFTQDGGPALDEGDLQFYFR